MRDFSFPLNIYMIHILHLKPCAPAGRGAEPLLRSGLEKGDTQVSTHLGVKDDDTQLWHLWKGTSPKLARSEQREERLAGQQECKTRHISHL